MKLTKQNEKQSYKQVIKSYYKTKAKVLGISVSDLGNDGKNLEGVRFKPEMYAYKDDNDRWRAGRLSKSNTGQFISGASARSLRGIATKTNNKIREAKRIMNSNSDLSWQQAIDKAVKVRRKYKQTLKNSGMQVKPEIAYKNVRAYFKVEVKESP